MVYKILVWVTKIFMGVQSKSFSVISSCKFFKTNPSEMLAADAYLKQ